MSKSNDVSTPALLVEQPHTNGNRIAALMTEDSARLANRVRQAMKELRLTQEATAALVGVSGATLSLWLNGRYAGDIAGVEAKVVRWLGSQEERVQVRAVVPEPPAWFGSATGQEIVNAFAYAQALGDMVAVAMVPGIGKSSACRQYQSTRSNVWRAEFAAHTTGVVPVLQVICGAVGGGSASGQPCGRASALAREIESRIVGRAGLLILDEVHHIDLKALDAIRALHDATGVAIALVGGPELLAKLERLPQLWSRLGMRLVRPRVQDGDVSAQLDAWEITGRAERAFLTTLAAQPGALRTVHKTLRLASMMARQADAGLTLQHIQDAAATLSARAATA